MITRHKIQRLLQKLAINLFKLSSPKDERKMYDYEFECIGICKSLIKDDRTKLMMSPISMKRYINSHDKQIFVIIENGLLTIVNHYYSYNIDLPSKSYVKLVNLFDNEMESRRMKMEYEIKSNVKHSLKNIYKSLVDEKV